MPELPEVETVANGVHARVAGQRIASVWTSGKPQTFKSSEEEIVATLSGAWIKGVRRVGKTIVMDLSRSVSLGEPPDPGDSEEITSVASPEHTQFLVHLGMTGRLLVSQPEVPLPPHTHAVLTLADGREVRFVDPRRFGRLSLHKPELGGVQRGEAVSGHDPSIQRGYLGPGAEPTTINAATFAKLFRKRKLAIKAALLNQSILHGVGNIYADESLFRAGIRPRKAAGRLTRAELERLHSALQSVLAKAIELGGSSVSDYVDADGMRGFFQLEHKVYGRSGELCHACSTPLKKIIVGGRTTIYCPSCQR